MLVSFMCLHLLIFYFSFILFIYFLFHFLCLFLQLFLSHTYPSSPYLSPWNNCLLFTLFKRIIFQVIRIFLAGGLHWSQSLIIKHKSNNYSHQHIKKSFNLTLQNRIIKHLRFVSKQYFFKASLVQSSFCGTMSQ